MKVLLSIKPKYVQKIISGEKQFEYRKFLFRRKDIESIVVYATKPLAQIIGEFHIGKILADSPQKIWNKTHPKSGVESKFFFQYFQNKKIAYAIEIKDFQKYPIPINPYKLNTHFTPPQSFSYIEKEENI